MDRVLRDICEELNLTFSGYRSLTGGDINDVFLVQSGSDRWVIKLNLAQRYPGMFEAEAKGLELLQSSQSFRIPKVKSVGAIDNWTYLVMEYLPTGHPKESFSDVFSLNLSRMHRVSQSQFGLDHDNYIGSLPQYNRFKQSASEFYIAQRLEPQIRMAQERGYSFDVNALYKNLEVEIPNEPPALVHGDLWSGNYLIGDKGEPILIDPAVAFAPREMDIAMMQLFGGFSNTIFSKYEEQFPFAPGWQKRIPIWQLYYLLVHLNLFGGGYHSQVKRIIDHYS